MKWFYLAGILLLGVLWCRANEEDLQDVTKNSSSNEDEDFFADMKNDLQKKCKKVGGDEAVNNLTKAIETAKVCLSQHLPKNTDELKELKDSSEGSSEEICTNKRTEVQECFTGIIEVWKDCSEDDEKYLPQFFFDAIRAVLDHICADQDAFVIKVINSLDCIFTLAENENTTSVCDDHIKDNSGAESLELLCENLGIAKTCYVDYVQKQCPDSDLKDLINGLSTAVISACDKRHRRHVPLSFRLY